MIFSYEVFPPGLELLVEIRFQPFTPALTCGAAQQAITDWLARGACLGAKTAQGHGRCVLRDATLPYTAEATQYRDSLQADRARLAEGLRSGTFTTELVLCAAR